MPIVISDSAERAGRRVSTFPDADYYLDMYLLTARDAAKDEDWECVVEELGKALAVATFLGHAATAKPAARSKGIRQGRAAQRT